MRDGHVKLIVNADDLGRTVKINEGVQVAFRNGIVSSTSVVANAPAFDHAVTVIHENPTLGVGVHLTLTEYPPLSESAYLTRLSGLDFGWAFASLMYATPAQLSLVEQEFRRQIDKSLSRNIRLAHLDGHCHVHVHPRLVGIVRRLARDYSLRYMRLPRERLIHGRRVGRYFQKCLLTMVCGFDTVLLGTSVRWPDEFHGFSEGGGLNRDGLRRILRSLRSGVNELMCHVGADNDDPPFFNGYHWRDELCAITSFTKLQLQSEFGIRVISYPEMES